VILKPLDIAIILGFMTLTLVIGLIVRRRGASDTASYFLGNRQMPWWLLGLSMVATTFSTDTPNLVTDIVRTQGVSGNWAWWSFLLTGMLTTFVFARLISSFTKSATAARRHRSCAASGPYTSAFFSTS
jgi:Na+/proline symporter